MLAVLGAVTLVIAPVTPASAEEEIEIIVTAPPVAPDPYIVPPPPGYVGDLLVGLPRIPVSPDPYYGTKVAISGDALELLGRGIIIPPGGPRPAGCYTTTITEDITLPVVVGSAAATALENLLRSKGIDQPIDANGILLARHTLTVRWATDGTNVTASAIYPRLERAPAFVAIGAEFAAQPPSSGAAALPAPSVTNESTYSITSTPIPGVDLLGDRVDSTITVRDSALLTDFAPNVNDPNPAYGAVASRPC